MAAIRVVTSELKSYFCEMVTRPTETIRDTEISTNVLRSDINYRKDLVVIER